ncbi:hypothetical protein CC1G_11682 [Coprinopsis cinerea okayama7|uniref:Uncharacterized protein n=1 Tax=Coprinopsis cinerea (strain Okayama-7 / 130 / ATCC MYA-4618 / FGSC 9003) TaxID=240176 RepID=A8P3U8_COPC7|nr:hypothetical protein CC1G_11682 [Coprinopsis cinerea okayama7\|eukprot:XP_001838620.1 hypothetical protein CC1G_11682 [Coprinopsis cinerea okayama7\
MLLETTPCMQNLNVAEMQHLLNYVSSRLRACASALVSLEDRWQYVTPPGLKPEWWRQLRVDLNHGLIILASATLQHPGKIVTPVFLEHLHRLLIYGGIDSPQDVALVVTDYPRQAHDYAVTRYVDCWWDYTPDQFELQRPRNLSVRDLVLAWKSQHMANTIPYFPPLPFEIANPWEEWKLKPIKETFVELRSKIDGLNAQLRDTKAAVELFELTCSKFRGLLDLRIDEKPASPDPQSNISDPSPSQPRSPVIWGTWDSTPPWKRSPPLPESLRQLSPTGGETSEDLARQGKNHGDDSLEMD